MVTSQLPISMDYASFTLSNGASDTDISATQSALWDNIVTARSMIIKTTKNITCKINSTLLPEFPIDIGDTPWQFPSDYILIKNLFLSNASGNDATIKIWLFG